MKSQLATQYLANLRGIEIGGAAHNSFELNTINADAFAFGSPQRAIYEAEQKRLCGSVMLVDVVCPGDQLPFPDNAFDFVISSHVIEHFYNPIAALIEWNRVASKYIFIIAPHIDRTFDRGTPETTITECIARANEPNANHPDGHHTFWRLNNFLELLNHLKIPVIATADPDDKVGNGFAVLVAKSSPETSGQHPVSFLNIITPCTRPQNLHTIAASINIPRENYRWIVVADTTKLIPAENIPANAEIYYHTNPESCYGHAQRNFALNMITTGHIYFNDDDTIIHPDLWREIAGKPTDFIHFPQQTATGQPRISGNPVQVGNIDTHNFVVAAHIAKQHQFTYIYQADGIFAAACFATATAPLYINKILSTYNALR